MPSRCRPPVTCPDPVAVPGSAKAGLPPRPGRPDGPGPSGGDARPYSMRPSPKRLPTTSTMPGPSGSGVLAAVSLAGAGTRRARSGTALRVGDPEAAPLRARWGDPPSLLYGCYDSGGYAFWISWWN